MDEEDGSKKREGKKCVALRDRMVRLWLGLPARMRYTHRWMYDNLTWTIFVLDTRLSNHPALKLGVI